MRTQTHLAEQIAKPATLVHPEVLTRLAHGLGGLKDPLEKRRLLNHLVDAQARLLSKTKGGK